MTKRFVCYLLTLCLLRTMMPITALAAEAEDPINVTLSLYSNISHDTYISGLYDDNVFYITLDKLCELVDGKVISRSNDQATIKVGIREFELYVGTDNMVEKLYSEDYYITIPSILKDGQIYISALHFLRYIGATVLLEERANIQFMVIKRYDISNAMEDFSASRSGYFFWWDEFDEDDSEIEDMIFNAGVAAIINRDSNVFRMIFDAKGIEREAVEDALLSIVKNEGVGYFDEDSKESELIDTASGLIGAESDWIGLIKDAYQDTSELGEQISGFAENAALTAGFTNNVVEAVESLKQFDNMSAIQKDLLATTILAHSNDSETLNNKWRVVLDAARNVNAKVQSEYAAKFGAAAQVAQSTAYDFINSSTGVAGANPVAIAWNAILLTKLIPSANQMIDSKDKLFNAYNSSMIQLIANEMLADAYLDWYYSNGRHDNIVDQYDMLKTIKQLMILQLKSTLTTREYLIQSGYLEESYAESMKTVNQEIALLLNKTENCKITGANMHEAAYDDDISWISKYNKPNYSNLVTDAYSEEFGGRKFSIPSINLSGDSVTDINAEIWANLYDGVVVELLDWWNQEHDDGDEYIIYNWYVNNDILSLVVETNPVSFPWVDYYVYNVSVSTGARISNNDLISMKGLSQAEYLDIVRQASGTEYFRKYQSYIERMDCSDTEYFRDYQSYIERVYDSNRVREQLENTISDENIQKSVPYINQNGQLCIIGVIYNPVGGSEFHYIDINLENYVSNPAFRAFSQYTEDQANTANSDSSTE